MKPFIVNKNSWHYRLNLNSIKQDKLFYHNEYTVKYVERRNDLCSYWKMTLYNIIGKILYFSFLSLVLLSILYFTYGICTSFLVDPMMVSIIIISLALVIFIIIFILNTIESYSIARQQEISNITNNITTDHLMKARYQAWKNKTCIKVEFEK